METPAIHNIPARLAAALVTAQTRAARFVKNDQYDSGYTHGYASHEAISNAARSICSDGGIGILLYGHTAYHIDDGLWLTIPVVVFHQSGETLPAFEMCVPMQDTLDETLAHARRAAYAQVLGLQWNGPGDQGRRALAATVPDFVHTTVGIDVTPSEEHADKERVPEPDHDGAVPDHDGAVPDMALVDPEVIDKARTAVQILRAQFSFPTSGDMYATATGCEPQLPAQASTLEYMAIIQLAALCEELLEQGKPIPRTHTSFLLAAEKQDSPVFSPIFTDGSPTESHDED